MYTMSNICNIIDEFVNSFPLKEQFGPTRLAIISTEVKDFLEELLCKTNPNDIRVWFNTIVSDKDYNMILLNKIINKLFGIIKNTKHKELYPLVIPDTISNYTEELFELFDFSEDLNSFMYKKYSVNVENKIDDKYLIYFLDTLYCTIQILMHLTGQRVEKIENVEQPMSGELSKSIDYQLLY